MPAYDGTYAEDGTYDGTYTENDNHYDAPRSDGSADLMQRQSATVPIVDEFSKPNVNSVDMTALHGKLQRAKVKVLAANRLKRRESVLDMAELRMRQYALKSLTEMKSRITVEVELEEAEEECEPDDPMMYPMKVIVCPVFCMFLKPLLLNYH